MCSGVAVIVLPCFCAYEQLFCTQPGRRQRHGGSTGALLLLLCCCNQIAGRLAGGRAVTFAYVNEGMYVFQALWPLLVLRCVVRETAV